MKCRIKEENQLQGYKDVESHYENLEDDSESKGKKEYVYFREPVRIRGDRLQSYSSGEEISGKVQEKEEGLAYNIH